MDNVYGPLKSSLIHMCKLQLLLHFSKFERISSENDGLMSIDKTKNNDETSVNIDYNCYCLGISVMSTKYSVPPLQNANFLLTRVCLPAL